MKNSIVIEKLKATNSRLEKEAIIKAEWDAGNTAFFEGLYLGLNPLKIYGIKQVPEKFINDGNEWIKFEHFRNLANDLHERTFTGHAARDVVLDNMNACDADEWNNFYRLVLLKDFKCGVSETTVNKVLGKCGKEAEKYLIPEFPYQRCSLSKSIDLSKLSWIKGVYSQLKSDGMFVNVNLLQDGTVQILSRAGRPFDIEPFESLTEEIRTNLSKDTQTHGEMLVIRDGKVLPRKTGNGILNSVSKGGSFGKNEHPRLVVWDQIPLKESKVKGLYKVAYENRFKSLQSQLPKDGNIVFVENKIVHSFQEAFEHYKELVAQGFEGTIIKDPTAEWKDGTSKLQIKMKIECDCDLEIVGFNPGKGKNALTFGSIIVRSSDALLEVSVSGFTDEERVEIWNNKDSLIGTIMTVKSNELMKPGDHNTMYSLFLPRFEEFRKDKNKADDLETIKQQFASVMS